MELFENGVGRPSNETIKKRNIFKGICVLLVIIIICLVAYIINDTKKDVKNDVSNNSETNSKEETIEEVDLSKLTTKKVGIGDFEKDIYDVYYGDKKIASSTDDFQIIETSKINKFHNYLIFNVCYNDDAGGCSLMIINGKGEVIGKHVGTGILYRGEYNIEGEVISESDGHQTREAVEMKNIYLK